MDLADKENIEQTLSIIKPDAVGKNVIGKIIDKFESKGLKIKAMKMVQLSAREVEEFYSVHKDKPFFKDLVEYITSGPIVAMVLEGKDAVIENRVIMGATNPKDAAPGTIRREFAESIEANAVHGSDSPENAKKEIAFFFGKREIY